MDITPLIPAGFKVIDGYGAGFFRIAGERQACPVFLTPQSVVPLAALSLAEMSEEKLSALLDSLEPHTVLLVGQGARFMGPVPQSWRDVALARQIVLEPMDSKAACRTWNVLLSEGRRVAAMLWPV